MNQIVEGSERLVYRRRRVRVMRVVDVKVVCTETPQGPLDLLHDEQAAQASTVRARLEPLLHLAGNDDVVAMTLQRHAKDLLRGFSLGSRWCAGTVEARLIAVGHCR